MLSMKYASLEDVDSVFELSNDPLVRAVSLHSDPILYENHVQWFKGIIHDADVLFLLFYEGNDLVAQVRFKRISGNEAEVSISVSGKYRGTGIASKVLDSANAELRARWNIHSIKAVVKRDNAASLAFFRKNGYVDQSTVVINGTACVLLNLILAENDK